MTRLRRLVASLGLLASAPVLAEPYTGGPMDDPLVRIVSWAIVLLACLGFSFLVAMVASRGAWRTRRFVLWLLAAFLVLLGLAMLVHAVAAISQIVSLVLHLIL